MSHPSLQTAIDSLPYPAEATVGIAVHDLTSGETAERHAARPFQLASVVKVPILVAAMHAADAGSLTLDERLTLNDGDKVEGGTLAYLDAGLGLTIRDLLTLMIIQSDNTATDMLLARLGGPEPINAAMAAVGLPEIVVRQTIRALLYNLEPIEPLLLGAYAYHEYIRAHPVTATPEKVMHPDRSNYATPAQITRLFTHIERGQTASAASTEAMRTILLRQTLNSRLPAKLPNGTRCAHKTGSIRGVRNDAGLIYLPDGRPVALSVFVEYPPLDPSTPEAAAWVRTADDLIATVARTVWDTLLG